jgi:hypothetical protein
VFSFHDVRLVGVDEVRRRFEVRLVTTLAPEYPVDTRLTGRFAVHAGVVHTALVIPPVVRQ